MTAGVQNLDSAAYLPPPPSTSTPDAKGTSAAGSQATDPQAAGAQGGPSDFQSELALQQSGTRPTGPQQAGPQPTESKTSPKADPGRSEKKRNVRPEDGNPSAVTPVQVADPQKPILPFSLALPQELAQPQENAKLDSNAQPDEKATPDAIAQGPAQQQVLSPSLAALKQSMKGRQSALPEATPNQTNATPTAVTDPGKNLVLPFAPVPTDTPVRQEGKKSEDPASQEATAPSQPVSSADLKLPATPAEPIASAVQGTANSPPSSPSALAFAARISAAQQKTDQAVAANSSQTPVPSPTVSGSQTAVEIPMRYAATAQIIQSAALGTQQDGPKKDTGDFSDRSARAGVRSDGARTDMVLPQFEAVSQPAGSSGSAAPQPAATPARAESVIEPPAPPPTSSHDIRVRVPDNNGGSTQLRFVESGGEVRVSVRTADEGLAQNLRTHLNDLTQRLSDGGMPAEIWKPASNGASSQNDSQQSQQDGRGSGGQGSGGQSGQQDRQQKRPAWLDEMEASLQGEQN